MRKIKVECPYCKAVHEVECNEYGAFEAVYCDPVLNGCDLSFVVEIDFNPEIRTYGVDSKPVYIRN